MSIIDIGGNTNDCEKKEGVLERIMCGVTKGSVIIPRMMEGHTLFPFYAVEKIMLPIPVL